MAESKFLKYQDKNADGLNDVCRDVDDIFSQKPCPPCKRNPNAIVPRWKEQETDDPWFNAKYCTMQCTVTTTVQSIIAPDDQPTLTNQQYVDSIFEQYATTAIKSLFEKFNKLKSDENIEDVKKHIQYTKYNLEARPNSYLQLLYSVPVENFANIAEATGPSSDDPDTGPIVVSYKGDELFAKAMKFRKGMYLFSRYYRVFQAIEGGLYYFEDGTAFTTSKFDKYGDPGFFGMFGKSKIAKILNDLDDWLNTKGYNIYGAGTLGLFKPRVTELEFTFSAEYKLTKLKIYTAVCGRKPVIFKEDDLTTLTNKKSFKDPTALAYFAQLDRIESFLGARVERPWTEFVEKYTYPKISSSNAAYGPAMDGASSGPTAGSCLKRALTEEGKQLGQSIMDDVFSLGDAIAYQFHKNTCKKSLLDVDEELEQMGLIMNQKGKPELLSVIDPKTNAKTNVFSMANSQAFEVLEKDNNIFTQMCAAFIGSQVGLGGDPDKTFQELWRDGFSRVKLCGLMDFMAGALQCLFGGLTLEQALAKALESALKAMSIDNFEELFIGLPPEKQAELDALVKRKLAQGQLPISRDSNLVEASEALQERSEGQGQAQSSNPDLSADTFYGDVAFNNVEKPWENKEFVKAAREKQKQGNYGEAIASYQSVGATPKDFRTVAQRFDNTVNSDKQMDPNSVMQAYIAAMIEVYSEDLLQLVDLLNAYPGAQIIAKIIAVFDCPKPPMFSPSFMDFIKSVDLPFCRNIQEIQIPKLINPFGYMPSLMDIMRAIYHIILLIIQRVIMSVIMRLLVKVCQIIGDAVCKALETAGKAAASLVFGPPTQISDLIRDAICGDDAAPDKVDATITEMFEKFGAGGAALSDSQAVKDFVRDLSASTNRQEFLGAIDGRPSDKFGQVGHSLLRNQYPQLATSFQTPQDVADLFANIGNVLPLDFRDSIRTFLDELPFNDDLPANPTLCASQQQIDDYKELQCSILEGRATSQQCAEMFSGVQDDFLEDLEDLSNVTNSGIGNAVLDELGPIVSTPGCDDGVFPFESPETTKAVNQALSRQFEQLHGDFSRDMLGNGGFFTLFGGDDSEWGLMNMILSDTKAKPLSTHRRKAFNKSYYVDVVTKQDFDFPDDIFLFFKDNQPPTIQQEGQFPAFVAEDLFFTMKDSTLSFVSNNTQSNIRKKKVFRRSFKELDFYGLFGTTDIDVLTLPDYGYDATFDVDINEEEVVITKGARKKTADVKLTYNDKHKSIGEYTYINNGTPATATLTYEYGIDVSAYFSEIMEITGSGRTGIQRYVNRPDDNVRVKINERTKDESKPNSKAENNRLLEFISVDDTLENIDLSQFPKFSLAGTTENDYLPQILMLSDLIKDDSIELATLKTFHDDLLSDILNKMIQKVAGPADEAGNPTKKAWLFGAKIDDLQKEDITYVVDRGQTKSSAGTEYGDAEVDDFNDEGEREGTREIENDDMILGISLMQHREKNEGANRENRVFYLDPKIYGGSYTKPKIYIKPIKNEGWLGMLDVIFPEAGPCKPQLTDLIDFKEIEDEISRTYATMPEDPRLQYEERCAVEYPFNRIMNRNAKAGVQGLIRAAARIYSSVHFIKSLATFTTFNTAIKENYSSLFASYVVEIMEKDFKDAQTAVWEFFNGFKDEEFWYAFLEQAVQTYGRLADDGELEMPPSVHAAITKINDAQESYIYPFRDELKDAKAIHRAQQAQTLKSWREESKYESIKKVEEHAKLVLKEFVRQELNTMAEKFNKNLKSVGITPEINDVNSYFLNEFCQGAEGLTLDGDVTPEIAEMPTSGEGYYTYGNELATPDGEPYVGYYHVHIDDDGNTIYMEGERHSTESHDELTLYAEKTIVPIGDIYGYSTGISSVPGKPFVIYKYTSINGTRYHPSTAKQLIQSHAADLNISDVFPGTLRFQYATEGSANGLYGDTPRTQTSEINVRSDTVNINNENSNKRIVGLSGELGVRHGIAFSLILPGESELRELTNVEIDALDVNVKQAQDIEPNSRLLLCLMNNLKDDEIYKAVTNYIVPMSKMTALVAVYNDVAFLPSIGQISVEKDDNNVGTDDIDKKPGARVFYVDDEPENGIDRYEYTSGWEHYDDRKPKFINFVKEWDDWDKILLRNSKARIKKLFKGYYNSRDWQTTDDDFDAARILVKNLKANLSLPAGAGLLSWWQRSRLLRTSPFNADGKLCTKKD